MDADIKLLYMKKNARSLVAGFIIINCLLMLFNCNNADSREGMVSVSSQPTVQKDTPLYESFDMYVSTEGLNVRRLPGADSEIVSVLTQNDKVSTNKINYNGWYKITAFNGNVDGYVNAKYLSDKPLSKEEIAAQKTVKVPQKTSSENDYSSDITPRAKLTKRPKIDPALIGQ